MSAIRHDMTLLISTESLMFGTFVVDESLRIVSWNEAATRTLGYDEAAVLGRTCDEMLTMLRAQSGESVICPGPRDAVLSPADLHGNAYGNPRPLTGQSPAPRRIRVVARDGEQHWLNLSVLQASTLDGSSCTVHVFRDAPDHAADHTTPADDTNQADAVGYIERAYATREEALDWIASAPPALPAAPTPGGLLRISPSAPANRTNHVNHANHANHVAASLDHLTPREQEVLELLAQGMATVEIALALGISRITARNHVTRVIEKLGVRTRLQAVLAASRRGLL